MKLIKDKPQKYEMELKIVFDVDRLEKVQKAEELLMEYGNIKQIIDFIEKVPNVNANKLENQIIKNISNGKVKPEELGHIVEKGMSIDKIEDEIIKMDSEVYMIWFSKNVKNANADKFKKALEKKEKIK